MTRLSHGTHCWETADVQEMGRQSLKARHFERSQDPLLRNATRLETAACNAIAAIARNLQGQSTTDCRYQKVQEHRNLALWRLVTKLQQLWGKQVIQEQRWDRMCIC